MLCAAEHSWRSLTVPCFGIIAQDDAHIFCLPSQIEGEILGVLDLTEKLLSQFGFEDFEVIMQAVPAWALRVWQTCQPSFGRLAVDTWSLHDRTGHLLVMR